LATSLESVSVEDVRDEDSSFTIREEGEGDDDEEEEEEEEEDVERREDIWLES